MKILNVLHTIIFAIYPFLFLFVHNLGEISLNNSLLPLISLITFSTLLYLCALFFVKDIQKTSFLISIFLLITFSWGHLYDAVDTLLIREIRPRYTITSFMISYFILAVLVIRTKHSFKNITLVLNVISFSLILILFLNISKFITLNIKGIEIPDHKQIQSSRKLNESTVKRDIYYFVFDRYGRADILKDIYNYDNSKFIDSLIKRGFYVAEQSSSNYLNTLHSLSSSLNLTYLTFLNEKFGSENKSPKPLYHLIQNHIIGQYFRSIGYKYYHFGSSWRPIAYNKNANFNYENESASSQSYQVLEIIFNKSLLSLVFDKIKLSDVIRKFLNKDIRLWKRERTIDMFEKLEKVINIDDAKFVFFHILLPHDPYVFDSNGNFIQYEEAKLLSEEILYIKQLKFTNLKIINLIDTILANSELSPIIIIQSDEGPYPRGYNNKNPNPSNYSLSNLRQKFGIINAYYLPEVDTSVLYNSITPVNSFRLILNLYFEIDIHLLPDENYTSNYVYYYKYKNVTKYIREYE